jgi:predicted amidohydrolase
VVCGCITDTRGHKRKSALVAENGRLQGVSDMLHAVDGEVRSGAALRVYETKIGRMGVAVAEDLYFPDVVKSLAICGSDFIVCVYDDLQGIEQVLIRANAFSYGVPILFCSKGYSMLADSTGELLFASAYSPSQISFIPKKEYHLVETRRCGFIRVRKDF